MAWINSCDISFFHFFTASRDGDSTEAAAGEIEEIVVTARKRAESLLEIPESVITVRGGIDRQQIKGLEDVGFQVPNLNLSMRLDGFPNVSVRGLGAFGNTQRGLSFS